MGSANPPANDLYRLSWLGRQQHLRQLILGVDAVILISHDKLFSALLHRVPHLGICICIRVDFNLQSAPLRKGCSLRHYTLQVYSSEIPQLRQINSLRHYGASASNMRMNCYLQGLQGVGCRKTRGDVPRFLCGHLLNQ